MNGPLSVSCRKRGSGVGLSAAMLYIVRDTGVVYVSGMVSLSDRLTIPDTYTTPVSLTIIYSMAANKPTPLPLFIQDTLNGSSHML